MRRNDFLEIKNLDNKTLLGKVMTLRGEISELVMDKNMSKLKDLRSIFKKKKEIAQILTVVKQKQLLEVMEDLAQGESEKQESESQGVKESEKEATKVTKVKKKGAKVKE
jgi:ribosomal protein L29